MIGMRGDSEASALASTVARCGNVAITVVGDLMLDEYVYGSVERISPEAPVPIVRARSNEYRLGGAANVARQIAELGATVTLVGMVGDDAAGDTLRRLCKESGIATQSILTVGNRPTTRKLRILSQSQQLLRIDWEDYQPASDENCEAMLQWVRNAAPPDALIFSDYAKGVLTPALMTGLLQNPNPRVRTIVVDPKHRDFIRYHGAKILTPNLRELAAAADCAFDPDDLPSIAAAARAQIQKGRFESLVVTLGDRGMLIVSADCSDVLIPALKRAVYDVTGAGDTATAVLTACLATGASVTTAARIANTAAGLAVGEIGAVAVPASRIVDALLGRPMNKLLSRAELQSRVILWRESGQRVVFTNGCFDLLHPGHLSLLNFAKSLGDVLVLAINSDAAVRRLKGPTRPVVSQHDRAALLGALECVDAVTIFDEDTPLETVRCVQPTILVKGQDYRMDEVVGRDIVEAAGGRVVLAPLLADYSTTSLLARARA
jgi:D-beta-D-heptose 7-phosphate kinase / D-beta-D-heptose 1-phosphate adenosyltransferase